MAEYIDAKRNIFRHQKRGQGLCSARPAVTRAMAAEAAPGVSVTLFGTDKTAGREVPERHAQIYRRDGNIYYRRPGGEPIEAHFAVRYSPARRAQCCRKLYGSVSGCDEHSRHLAFLRRWHAVFQRRRTSAASLCASMAACAIITAR